MASYNSYFLYLERSYLIDSYIITTTTKNESKYIYHQHNFFFENQDLNFIKLNQTWFDNNTEKRCGGTSSIHTYKPATCRAFFARLWATALPSLRTWVNKTRLTSVVILATSRMWPKGAKESSLLCKDFIMSSESPSKMNLEKPSSAAKERALAATIASTRSEEKGSWIYSVSEANTWPKLSRITTPRPALFT